MKFLSRSLNIVVWAVVICCTSSLYAVQKSAVTAKEHAVSMIQEGLNCLILEQNKKAEEYFIRAKSLDPYSEQAYNFVGLLYMQEDLNEKAEDMLKKAVAIEPMYPEALRNLGKLYLRQDKFAQAAF
ncbi:MAG: tetratricopeptide repeat protein, partial [Candidatus Riflebacteria bacterium]